MPRWHHATALLLTSVLLAGCMRPAPPRSNVRLAIPSATDGRTSPTPGTPPLLATTRGTEPTAKVDGPVITTTPEGGVISGRLRWDGSADPTAGARLRVDPASQGIADAVVWVAKAPGAGIAAPGASQQLSQRDRVYHPHVQTALRGTRLKLLTIDDKASFKASGASEFSVNPQPGKPEERPLDRVGLVEFRSEIEPALSAYIHVFDHPYFAKTDANGAFRLADKPLPPGKYEVILWHEGWRSGTTAVEKKATVDVGSDKGVAIEWTLSGRDAEKK